MTKNRKAMLDILTAAHEPLSVSDVYDRLPEKSDQVTVYRTLHYLEEQGLADSFILHCEAHGTKRYYAASPSAAGDDRAHHHWFHCERCHGFTDLGGCRMEALVREWEGENGIEIKTHTLFLTGVCAKCR